MAFGSNDKIGVLIDWLHLGQAYTSDALALVAWRQMAQRDARHGDPTATQPPVGAAYYNSTTSRLRVSNGTTWDEYMPGGAGGATWDTVITAGRTVTKAVGDGALTINDADTGVINTLAINRTGTGSGNALDVNLVGASSGAALDATIGAVAYTGDLIALSMGGTATGSQAVVIDTTANHTVPLMSAVANSNHTAGLLALSSDSTSATGHMIDLDGHGDGNFVADAININLNNGAAASQAIVSSSNTAHSTNYISHNLTGIHTAPLMRLTSRTTNANGHIISIASTGGGAAYASDAININLDDAAVGAQWLNAQNDNVFSTPQVELLADGAHTESVIQITTAGVGAAGQPTAIDVVGSAALVAGADMVRLAYTGSPSASSNVLSIEQSVGAGALGSHCLYINATGANVEGLRVDAGTSTFDEVIYCLGGIAAMASSWAIADPGNGNAIAVTISGVCSMTSGGAETRTMAIPTFIGQQITLVHDVDGGVIAVTVASAFNEAGNSVLTFTDVGESCTLIAGAIAGTRAWRLLGNDGVALS